MCMRRLFQRTQLKRGLLLQQVDPWKEATAVAVFLIAPSRETGPLQRIKSETLRRFVG